MRKFLTNLILILEYSNKFHTGTSVMEVFVIFQNYKAGSTHQQNLKKIVVRLMNMLDL